MKKLLKELDILKDELGVISLKEINDKNSKFLNIKNYQVILKNGAIFNRQKLVKRGSNGDAVIIVPITEDNEAIVIVEPRVFTEEGVSVEVPAGYVDGEETPYEAAKRELEEEIGYTPASLILLKTFYQDQGISSAKNTCFLALGCKETSKQNLDQDEYIKYQKCSIKDLYKLVDASIICDANGIIAVGEVKKYLSKLRRKSKKTKGE